MSYRVDYLESVVRKDISTLDKTTCVRIRREIERKLMVDPIKFGKPLQYSLKGCRRLRVGDWRIIYVVAGFVVTIVKIGHRREIYD